MLSLRWCVALAMMIAVTGTRDATAQIAVPATVLEQPEAPFPEAARAAGVDGEVRFRATIDATGRVQAVDIESVPQTGLGFEEAVVSAVSRWRFSPALLRGTPVVSDFTGGVRFTLSLPGQAMLSASSSDTWTAVRAMMRQLKMPVDKVDDRTQLLTSGAMKYAAVAFPGVDTLRLPLGFKPNRVTLHVYVTPRMEPARIAIGSVIDLEPIASNDTRHLMIYGHDAISQWFLTELTRRMGVRMEPMGASAARRAAQSGALMPPGLTDPCTTRPADLVGIVRVGGADTSAVKRPQLLQEITPIYPKDQLDARRMAKIVFRGEITEHGTLVDPRMTEPADAPTSFVRAAQLAFGLWRFTPSEAQGCPVRVNASFESTFTLR